MIRVTHKSDRRIELNVHLHKYQPKMLREHIGQPNLFQSPSQILLMTCM